MTHDKLDKRPSTSWIGVVGLGALVSYAVVWLPFFWPVPGHLVSVYAQFYPVTLALFTGLGLLVGGRRHRPWVGAATGLVAGILLLALPFRFWSLAVVGAVLGM